MNGTIVVLSVGTEETVHRSHTMFLEQHYCAVSVVQGYCGFFQLPASQVCDVAVLQATLSREELHEIARIIRSRWPKAKILIIRDEDWGIEDALYDDRVKPGTDPEVLLEMVQRTIGWTDVALSQPETRGS